jgi:hypothetical protein
VTVSTKGQFKRWLTPPPRPLEVVYRPLGVVLAVGAAIALLPGWLAPAPWLLAALMVAILTALWFFVVVRMIRGGVWGETPGEAS